MKQGGKYAIIKYFNKQHEMNKKLLSEETGTFPFPV